MTCSETGRYFEDDSGVVYAVSQLADGRIFLVEVPEYTDAMGTIACEMSTAEWREFSDKHGLIPCDPLIPKDPPGAPF